MSLEKILSYEATSGMNYVSCGLKIKNRKEKKCGRHFKG